MSITILCYHKVSSDPIDGSWLNVSPDTLAAHLRFFKRRRFAFVTAAELAGEWPGKGVCFTFDDAYSTAIDCVPEIFGRYGVRATFYAVPSKVGRASDWDGDRARPLASWESLAAAIAEGHEVGNHSFSHADLAKASLETQETEIREARRELEERRFPQGSFCYPYGHHTDETKRLLVSAGYKVGLALGKRPASISDDRLALPRIVMAYRDSAAMLLYKLYIRPRLDAR